MPLYRFECRERSSHDHVLIEANNVVHKMPNARLSVPCPVCGRSMKRTVVR